MTNEGVTTMTSGIKVLWLYNKSPYEVEYFAEIDVDDLSSLPAIRFVPTMWLKWNGGKSGTYEVDATCEPTNDGKVRLIVHYVPEKNHDVPSLDDIVWGRNEIVLTEGERTGPCEWQPDEPQDDDLEGYSVHWEAFDLGESHARPLAKYSRSRRDSQFRGVILDCDRGRCVLTNDNTTQALEAAHLIPAEYGENDMPFNGIALRADLHRLFDAGLFTFGERGEVVFTRKSQGLSPRYRRLLQGKTLPEPTLNRVRATLAHPQFRGRKNSSYRVDTRRQKT